MKTVYLHVGIHKTATTSIQQSLIDSRHYLSEQGYYLPIYRFFRNPTGNHSALMYTVFSSSPENYHNNVRHTIPLAKRIGKYRQILDEWTATDKDLILSGEDISLLSKVELSNLKTYFEQKGFTVVVLMYLRRPYPLLLSHYQQILKTGRYTTLGQVELPFAKYQKIRSVFSTVKVFSFEEVKMLDGGVTDHFYKALGIAKESAVPYYDINKSSSDQVVRMLRYLNFKEPLISKNIALNPHRKNHDTYVFDQIQGDQFKLTQAQFEPLKRRIAIENKYLFKHLGSAYVDQKIELYAGPKPWTELQRSKALTLSAGFSPQVQTVITDYLNRQS
ncbi:hypothetical protein QGN29_02315 [Temperatibacter marinus]|uniref:Sulfotransferase domain-containing protein n=1 Tax=Temperatibacter marinus TaxID=1456591 RepID=A0AA52H9H5_9PROT|nr:hypothetical protein [Temperatibacter marinus]WND03201.1 hypothetical protein QGN29_02315 [Temperatibacter marinus]